MILGLSNLDEACFCFWITYISASSRSRSYDGQCRRHRFHAPHELSRSAPTMTQSAANPEGHLLASKVASTHRTQDTNTADNNNNRLSSLSRERTNSTAAPRHFAHSSTAQMTSTYSTSLKALLHAHEEYGSNDHSDSTATMSAPCATRKTKTHGGNTTHGHASLDLSKTETRISADMHTKPNPGGDNRACNKVRITTVLVQTKRTPSDGPRPPRITFTDRRTTVMTGPATLRMHRGGF